MKPKNMPERKLRRQLRAKGEALPRDLCTPPDIKIRIGAARRADPSLPDRRVPKQFIRRQPGVIDA